MGSSPGRATAADPGFRDQVHSLVERIPRGRVMSYGQIAALCGRPRAARVVGRIAATGPGWLPWQRVVHVDGSLAAGFVGQRAALARDGVRVGADGRVDIDRLEWWPQQ
jgi:alkylated DNA nucleotide flippase Atl1